MPIDSTNLQNRTFTIPRRHPAGYERMAFQAGRRTLGTVAICPISPVGLLLACKFFALVLTTMREEVNDDPQNALNISEAHHLHFGW